MPCWSKLRFSANGVAPCCTETRQLARLRAPVKWSSWRMRCCSSRPVVVCEMWVISLNWSDVHGLMVASMCWWFQVPPIQFPISNSPQTRSDQSNQSSQVLQCQIKLVTDQIWLPCHYIHHHVSVTKQKKQQTAYLMLSHLWCYQELSVQLRLPHEGSLPDRQRFLVGIWHQCIKDTASWIRFSLGSQEIY